jgi:hypothetical protein
MMSVLSRIRRIAGEWLPGRASRLGGWLLLAVAAVAVWPVAAVTGAGCLAARLRGWPAARLGRQAAWALPMTAVWIAAESARGWRAVALDPVRDGGSGWPHLTVTTVFRTFLLVAPVTIPAGLALAALLWAWRIYAATQVPNTQAPVTLPAPRRETVPVARSRDDILRPGVRR